MHETNSVSKQSSDGIKLWVLSLEHSNACLKSIVVIGIICIIAQKRDLFVIGIFPVAAKCSTIKCFYFVLNVKGFLAVE